MRIVLVLLLAVMLGVACSSESSEVKISHITKTASDGAVKNVAQIQIEGMMCEQACVNKVSKELNELECVASVEIDFDTDKPIDIAVVEFDADACNEQTMIEKIQSIGDGLYQVKSVEVLSYQ